MSADNHGKPGETLADIIAELRDPKVVYAPTGIQREIADRIERAARPRTNWQRFRNHDEAYSAFLAEAPMEMPFRSWLNAEVAP